MNDHLFGVFDMGVVGVAVVGLGVWQLVSINREIGRDKAKRDTPDDPSPEGSGHPIGEHRLDDR